jgi:phytanoyl-CoA hydroxylase
MASNCNGRVFHGESGSGFHPGLPRQSGQTVRLIERSLLWTPPRAAGGGVATPAARGTVHATLATRSGMMLSQQQVDCFRRDGFVLGGQVLDSAAVQRLRDELQRVIDQKGQQDVAQPLLLRNLSGDDAAPVWQVVNIWQASEAYRQLIHHRQIAEEVAQLTGARELRLWHDQIQYKPAERGGVNHWHQDSPLWGNLQPKDQQVSAWIALDDVDEDNGCMSMVPGSHLWGPQPGLFSTIRPFENLPAEFQGHPIQRRLAPVRKGHVHYHHALTWHGSHANRSGRMRRAIAIHMMTEQTVYDARGSHPMKPFIHVEDGQKIEGDAFPLVWGNR